MRSTFNLIVARNAFIQRARMLMQFAAAAICLLVGATASQPAFAVVTFNLTVSWHGPGSVTISASDGSPSFNCSTDNCTANYVSGTAVTLTPNDTTGNFLRWDGACSGFGTCQLTMSGDRGATAMFKYKLRINVAATAGSINVDADQDYVTLRASLSGLTYYFPEGTSVALTASAKTNHEFLGWGNACAGTGTCSVSNMTSDVTVDTNFRTLTYPLHVNILGLGSPGTVISSPSGISCPPTCDGSFDNGAQVTLSVTPKPGYVFNGAWGNPPCPSPSTTCSIDMNSSQTVGAAFAVATTLGFSTSPLVAKPGQSVTLMGAVHIVPSGTGGTPSGSVIFMEGARTLGTAPLVSGTASLSVSGLTIGGHSITAQYTSDSIFFNKSSTSGTAWVLPVLKNEARVNTFTAGAQQFPAVAKLKTGYMVVWASNAQDGNGYGVYGQRYDALGAKAAGELHISTATSGNQSMPKVAGLKAGGLVVVWQSDRQDANTSGIYGQTLSATGGKTGSEFKVNTTSAGAQTQPAIAALSGGGFVVAWASAGQDGSGLGIYAKRYDANAHALGGEFKVNTTTAGDQSAPAVAATKDGGFVVAWQAPGANGLGIFAQRYDSAGRAAGSQLAVNKTTVSDQSLPSVAGLSDGTFVVVWQSNLQDGVGLGVYAQRFTAAGVKSGGEVKVNTFTSGDQWQPQVSAFADGGFVVLWTSNSQDGSSKGVYAQTFTNSVTKDDVEFRVNTTTLKDQWQPTVAAASGGEFMAAWTSRDQDGSVEGVYNGLFLVPPPIGH